MWDLFPFKLARLKLNSYCSSVPFYNQVLYSGHAGEGTDDLVLDILIEDFVPPWPALNR